jgi:hypothetical protein
MKQPARSTAGSRKQNGRHTCESKLNCARARRIAPTRRIVCFFSKVRQDRTAPTDVLQGPSDIGSRDGVDMAAFLLISHPRRRLRVAGLMRASRPVRLPIDIVDSAFDRAAGGCP